MLEQKGLVMSEVKRAELDGIGKTQIDQFLVPEAMLTPGVAGGMIMVISNALSNNFEFNAHERGYLGLALSFIFGLLIINSSTKLMFRIVYYVANSFIIFAVAFGTGTLASTSELGEIKADILVSEAYAQAPNSPNSQESDKSRDEPNREAEQNKRRNNSSTRDDSGNAQPPTRKSNSFFQPWANHFAR